MESARWLADFDAAVEKGMALTISQQAVNDHARQHHARGFDLATGTLERLVVVGLEWTKDPATSAQDLADLLRLKRLSGMNVAAWVRTENAPIYALEHLEQQRVFTSVLTVTYRIVQ